MNKKIIFKTALGDIRYCVLDTATDCISQMEKVFGVEKGYGFSIEMDEKEIRLRITLQVKPEQAFQSSLWKIAAFLYA